MHSQYGKPAKGVPSRAGSAGYGLGSTPATARPRCAGSFV